MEIYKHKVSGKYFIYIEDTRDGEALFVNPLCRLLSLPLSSFSSEVRRGKGEYFYENALITREQLETWQNYSDDHME
jgi:hypothetical protein